MSNTAHHTFETPEQLHAWLHANHASETEVWVRILKRPPASPAWHGTTAWWPPSPGAG